MSVHNHSIAAIKWLSDGGSLGAQQSEVLSIFIAQGSMSLREASQYTDMELMSVRSRATELQGIGLLEECGETKCSWSGRTVAVLRATHSGFDLKRKEAAAERNTPVPPRDSTFVNGLLLGASA